MPERGRFLHYTQAGMRSQVIEVAQDAEPGPSKRSGMVEESDRTLDENMVELDEGTRARNRAFQERLDEVWKRTNGWEAKLKTECIEADETIQHMRDNYQRHVDKLHETLRKEINAGFDHIDNDLYPLEIARVGKMDKEVDFFFDSTVPECIEQQSGVVSRALKKQYEAFNIEQVNISLYLKTCIKNIPFIVPVYIINLNFRIFSATFCCAVYFVIT
jgi:hypothetical protein